MNSAILIFSAFLAQACGQGVPLQYQRQQITPSQFQMYGSQMPGYGQIQMASNQFQAQRPQVAAQVAQGGAAVEVSNEQLLSLAAQNGMDVESIKQQLQSGRPVEIEISQLNSASRPQQQEQQNQNQFYFQQQYGAKPQQASLNNPQAIKNNLQQLINTALDSRMQQIFQTKEFKEWHTKLIQENPQITGIRNVGQKA